LIRPTSRCWPNWHFGASFMKSTNVSSFVVAMKQPRGAPIPAPKRLRLGLAQTQSRAEASRSTRHTKPRSGAGMQTSGAESRRPRCSQPSGLSSSCDGTAACVDDANRSTDLAAIFSWRSSGRRSTCRSAPYPLEESPMVPNRARLGSFGCRCCDPLHLGARRSCMSD